MEMNAIQVTAVIAIGYENAPRWNGPRTNFLRYITLRAIGIPERIIFVKDHLKAKRQLE
jgi:hypothetical protein